MDSSPILSINIPTFNRLPFLQEALAVLIPQVSDEVEINVTDNHSTDGTWEYLATLEGKVGRSRPDQPIDANYNILSCLSLGRGAYTWIHCDDDVAKPNAAENIVRGIESFGFPPALTFRWIGLDAAMTGFVNMPVTANWKECDRNEFLRVISYQFTFASAIIVKRGCVDIDYIRSHAPLNLIPGAIMLAAAGRYNEIVLCEEMLLTARSGSSSNTQRLTIFSKEIWELFEMNRQFGYKLSVFRQVYSDSLETVLVDAAVNYGVTWRGAWDVARYSFLYKKFYTKLCPVLARRLLPGSLVRSIRLLRTAVRVCYKVARRNISKLQRLFNVTQSWVYLVFITITVTAVF